MLVGIARHSRSHESTSLRRRGFGVTQLGTLRPALFLESLDGPCGRIDHPEMRQLNLTEDHVARATRSISETQFQTTLTRADDKIFGARVERILAKRPAGPFLVFAYGSLIWKPTFDPVARHRAVAPGWHRQFCIEIRGFRGTPDQPGLMMALMSGGRCNGIALEAEESSAGDVVDGLVRRETPFVEHEGQWRWITVETEHGKTPALVFWAGPSGPSILRSLPLDTAAATIARACGYGGSCAEYLRNTVLSLEQHGIRDRNLWVLQRMVATEIDRHFPHFSDASA